MLLGKLNIYPKGKVVGDLEWRGTQSEEDGKDFYIYEKDSCVLRRKNPLNRGDPVRRKTKL